MPTPTVRELHIDQALTNVSIKYQNAELIAEKIFPVVPVQKESNLIFIYGKQDFRLESDIRAPGSRAKQVEWNIEGTARYAVVEHAYEMQLIDEVRNNADNPIKYDEDSTEYLTNKIKLNLEKNVADVIQNEVNYDSGNVSEVSTKWNNYANSDPLADIEAAKEVVRNKIFMYPNTLVINDYTFRVLRRHPKLLDMYKYTRGGVLTVDILKELFEVENLLIGGSGYLTSKKGKSDEIGRVWGNNAILLYVSKTPGIKQLSYGYIFRIAGFPLVERWRDDATRSDWIRVSDKYDIKVIAPVAGYLLKNVIE
jgi:hypothetical protein